MDAYLSAEKLRSNSLSNHLGVLMRSQFSIHNKSIYPFSLFIGKRFGDLADYSKPQFFPKLHRPGIALDHEIELHRGIAKTFCFFQRIFPHLPSDSPSVRPWRGHISSIGNM